MPELTAPAAPAAAASAATLVPEFQPTATPNPDLEAVRTELLKYKTENGRLRNRVGAAELRARELETIAFRDSSGATEPSPDAGTNTGYMPQYAQAPQYGAPAAPQGNFVSREEWDLDRFERRYGSKPEFVQAVRNFAQDGNKVGNFIRHQVDSWGRPVVDAYNRAVPDVYRTYEAIASHLELEQLRKTQQSPSSNPNQAVISGTGANAVEPTMDLSKATWQDMAKSGVMSTSESDPPSFARGSRPLFPGR